MNPDAIKEGNNNLLPLAKNSPGVAHAHAIQQMVAKLKALRTAVKLRDPNSDPVT
jgi:hypothetical protein